MPSERIIHELMAARNEKDAQSLQRFFKTGKGEYGEGDVFLGVRMPVIRFIVRMERDNVSVADCTALLHSTFHEVRMAGAIALTLLYKRATHNEQKEIYDSYINVIGDGINNWDLVDVTCPHVVGAYLYSMPRKPLYDLANGGLWHKRVSLISTFYFISRNDVKDAVALSEKLVYEEHDLLHKAVGWVMREVGKNQPHELQYFLEKFAATMPRTALRYAIEKLPPHQRDYYMHKK